MIIMVPELVEGDEMKNLISFRFELSSKRKEKGNCSLEIPSTSSGTKVKPKLIH